MRPYPFADLLKQWLADAGHPHVAQVQTCTEIGRHEQPAGVRVRFDDGWAFLLQVVRTSPDVGEAKGEMPPTPDLDGYRAARSADEAAARQVKPPARGGRPLVKAGAFLPVVLEAIKRADHPGVVSVEVSSRTGRDTLRVSCTDRSTVYVLPVGFFPPGSTDLAHPAHQVPEELA